MAEAARHDKRRREVLAAVLGVVAVVLIWRAIWDMTAAIMSPLTSLIFGLVLIGVIAYFNRLSQGSFLIWLILSCIECGINVHTNILLLSRKIRYQNLEAL